MRKDEFPIIDKYVEKILEDIKSEIIHYNTKHCNSEYIMVGSVIEIIDKYKIPVDIR